MDKYNLKDAGAVPQIHKDDAALIPGTGDRTADGHLLPGIGQADLAAVIGTAQGPHRFHSSSPLYIIRQRAGAGRPYSFRHIIIPRPAAFGKRGTPRFI